MSTPVTTRRFTVDEYHRMAAAGVLREDDRVELLDGQIVVMTPIGERHAGCVNRLTTLLAPLAGTAATLSVQNPIVLGEHQEPQPDVALLRYRADGYASRLPRAADVLLVIEVAATSGEDDRQRKLPAYARAGIPEAWLVDLAHEVIEGYREPGAEGYHLVKTFKRGDELVPLAFPAVSMSVEQVLG